MKIFTIEKELRLIKNRGYFPVPQITPQDNKIETSRDKNKILEAVDEEAIAMKVKEQEQVRVRDEQLRSARQTNRSDFNYLTLANSTPIRNDNARSDQLGVHFNTNPIRHIYSTTADRDDQYEPPVNDSIIQGAGSAPTDQFATNTIGITGHNKPWRCTNSTNTATNTASHRMSTRPTGRNGLCNNNSPNSSDTRNCPTCFRCREQGHMRLECRERVFCNNCKTYNHDTKACRKQHNNIPSPANSQITMGYHPTATPPPLIGTTTGTQPAHQMGTNNNSPLFQNLFDNNQLRTSTMLHNGTSPAASPDIVEGLTQILTQVTNNNKRDDASKQMMKNIKIFDGSNKAECITWLNQVEAATRFTKTPFRELICQSMAPAMLHVFSELSVLASDEDIKDVILTNYSDIPSTTEAATRLQNMQISTSEPLITFNHRYEAIHKVAFGLSPRQQENKTVIVEYAKKLPMNTRDKLLRKIGKKNSYIKTLDDAFRQAIDINRETSFVEAATGRYNDQSSTKIETQINELEDSFQEFDINAMNTRSTNRSRYSSWNGSFDRSSSRNNSLNSSQNSRSNYRGSSYSSNNDSYNRQGYNRDNSRNRGYQQQLRYKQRNQNYQNRYDNNQDRNRFDNRRRPNKYQHHRNQHKAQVIFKFSDQNMMEMMQMVRGFINLIKANAATREQYKSNKLATRKYNNEVKESEIHSSSLDQVQQFFNEDTDLVFNALVAADYIDKIDCTDGTHQQQA